MGNDQGAQGEQFSSLQDEVNQRFRLPRTAVGMSDHDTNTLSTFGNGMNGLPLSSNAIQPTNPAPQSRPERFNALANYGDQLGSVVEAEWATVLYIPDVVKEVLPQIEATTNPLLTGTNYF
jgi:hypothetical protein